MLLVTHCPLSLQLSSEAQQTWPQSTRVWSVAFGPHSKQRPSPRAAALMHSARCGPGENVWVQKCAQALFPSLAAHATLGTEANAAPTRAPPIHLSAWPLETVPLARPLATASKRSWFIPRTSRTPRHRAG
jgi:hypothetical protein